MQSAVKNQSEAATSEAVRIRFRCDPYLGVFHQMFPGEMKLFELLGIHPVRSKPVANIFSLKHPAEDFRNIGEHSIAVAIAARALAKALVHSGIVPLVYVRRVMQRALLHDAFKGYEVLYARAHGPCADMSVCRERVLHFLSRERVPSYLVEALLTAGRETGHESLREFLVEDDGAMKLVDTRLGDKIVHLADSLVDSSLPPASETFFTTASARIGKAALRYPFLFNAGIVKTGEGVVEHCDDVSNLPSAWRNLGTYVELQHFASAQIQKEICAALIPGGIHSTDETESFMLYLLRDSLRTLSESL